MMILDIPSFKVFGGCITRSIEPNAEGGTRTPTGFPNGF